MWATGLVIVIVLILVYWYWQPRVAIGVDGRVWNVASDYHNNTEAAQLLSRLHTRMIKFLNHLRLKYHVDITDDMEPEPKTWSDDVQKIVDTLLDNYNPDVFYENDPRYSGDTSYTLNKGDSMYVCLRKRSDPTQLEDPDVIFFVMLHECAHIANYNGWGHTDRFWTVFKFLLHEAVLAGVYTPIDFDNHPRDYCGLRIYYSVLSDKALPNLWEDI
jgi:hypothetical protein